MTKTLTMAEAAARAGLSEMTVRRRMEAGELTPVMVGARKRFRPEDIDRVFLGKEPPPKTGCRIIALANQKGGVGKTTATANLATALSQAGARVLAVDCDPQGNLTQALGPNPDDLEITLYNVLVERTPIERAILSPILNTPSLSLVGANLDLAAADPQLAGFVAREMRLRQALESIVPLYDYIFLDCPPALGMLTLNALTAATEIIVPVDVGVFSLRGVAKLQDTIAEVRSVNPNLRRVSALMSRADNTNLASEVRAELAQSFGKDLLKTSIRRSVKVSEAQAARQPITLFRPSDPVAKDYMALAEEVRNGA